MMRVVIAPDSFKGSLSAAEAVKSIVCGVRRVYPRAEIKELPLSDGGEGLVESLVGSTGGHIFTETVKGPLFCDVEASWGMLGDGETAVIEMATASGLLLVPEDQRNPLYTTTYGTGELIKAAVARGCSKIIVGIGGSATNDGGMGMAQALGVKFLDEDKNEIGHGGGCLGRLAFINTEGLVVQGLDLVVACDVNNPLTGPRGASAVYGPQKGATPTMVRQLDQNLVHYAQVIHRNTGKDVEQVPGAGAAGGLGAGLLAFLGGRLRPGIDVVMETVGLEREVQAADLVITGEGKVDGQTRYGKVPLGVARCARKYGVPTVVLAGCVEEDADGLHEEGVTAYFSIADRPMTLETSMHEAERLLANTTAEVMRLWQSQRHS